MFKTSFFNDMIFPTVTVAGELNNGFIDSASMA